MPKQLNNGRVTQALQRAFGFKGRYIPMLDEVIVPVYNIQDPSPSDPSRLCAATLAEINTVGVTQTAATQLFNPLGSGVVINFTGAVVQSNVKMEVLVILGFDQLLSDAAGAPFFRDRRIEGLPAGITRNEKLLGPINTTVAILQVDGAFSQVSSWVSESSDPRQPLVVLPPGTGLIFKQRDGVLIPAVGDELRTNFRWMEIPESEVNPPGGLP